MSAVLIVEDRENVRLNLRAILADEGLQSIEAADKSEALTAFRSHAGLIAGVITDCRLDDDDSEKDVSGIEVGRALRTEHPSLPIYCYTAFEIDDFIREDNPFNKVFRKSTSDSDLDIGKNISTLCNTFRNYDASKFADIPSELDLIRRKYSIADEDFLRLISMAPISSIMQTALSMSHELQLGGSLDDHGTSGNQIVLLSPGDPEIQHDLLKKPFSVVYKSDDSVHLVEVFGMPSIYAYGETFSEAKIGLVNALASYSRELEQDTSSIGADNFLKFRAFLNEVIDGS